MSDYQLTCLVHDPQRTAHEVTSSRRLNVGVLQLVHHRTVGAQADVGAQFGTLTQMAPVVRRHLQQQQSVATFCNCCHTVTKCTLLFNIRLKSPRIRCPVKLHGVTFQTISPVRTPNVSVHMSVTSPTLPLTPMIF